MKPAGEIRVEEGEVLGRGMLVADYKLEPMMHIS